MIAPVSAWAIVRDDGVPIMILRDKAWAERLAALRSEDRSVAYRVVKYAPALLQGGGTVLHT